MTSPLEAIVAEHGTPCYVYLMDDIRDRIAQVRATFGDRFAISYAVKSNPNPDLLRRLREQVDTLDVSSGGELELALATGWEPARVTFTGPAKRAPELAAAASHSIGEVVVESVREAEALDDEAARRGVRQPILIRVSPAKLAPGFGIRMAGRASQFGVDEEELDDATARIAALPHLRLDGFHIYSGTQCLRPTSLADNLSNFIEIFRRAAATHDLEPVKLVFGAGFGVPYFEDDVPLDLSIVAAAVNPALDRLRSEPRFRSTVFVLETGRYLVSEAGIYLTRVISRKRSRGTEFAICDGGLNHHITACGHLGSVIHRNYRMFKLGAEESPAEPVPHDLVGPLCTAIDTLGRGVLLPPLEVGDVVGVRSSGAYGLTASPVHFIRHPPAKEILVEGGVAQPASSSVSSRL